MSAKKQVYGHFSGVQTLSRNKNESVRDIRATLHIEEVT